MSSFNNFKDIADEVMEDIVVSDELKQKTLKRIRNRKINFFKSSLIPVACVLVLAASIPLFNSILKAPSNNIQEGNILRAPGGNAKHSKSTVSVSLNSLAEAKEFIGNSLLAPTYLPEDSKLRGIQGVSFGTENRKSVWIQYAIVNKTFVISVEEKSEWKSFEGYEDIDINGEAGHMKVFKDGSYESTELRWFVGKNLYTIEGEISEGEAIKTARNLK